MREYHFTETRPWGGFTILLETPTYKVKELVIKPGQRLSYQLHHKRSEHWFIVQGQGVATFNDEERVIAAGATIDIPVETKHRVKNASNTEDLVLIEVQTGTYFGEDDIIRFSDDYQRAL